MLIRYQHLKIRVLPKYTLGDIEISRWFEGSVVIVIDGVSIPAPPILSSKDDLVELRIEGGTRGGVSVVTWLATTGKECQSAADALEEMSLNRLIQVCGEYRTTAIHAKYLHERLVKAGWTPPPKK